MRFLDSTARRVTALGVTSVLIAGAIALPALAQSRSQDTSEGVDDNTPEIHERIAIGPPGLADALAEELDLSADQVDDALTAAQQKVIAQAQQQRIARLRERLDAAVEDGTLTQEQADAIVAAADSGVLDGPALPGGPPLELPGPGAEMPRDAARAPAPPLELRRTPEQDDAS